VRTEAPASSTSGGEQADESKGELDLLVEAEAALLQVGADMNRLPPLMDGLAAASQRGAERMADIDTSGGGFADKLQAAREFARDLEKPVADLDALAKSYVENLIKVHPMMELVFQGIETGQVPPDQAETFLQQMIDLASAAETGLGAMRDLAQVLVPLTRISKDLRGPATRLNRALLQFADTQVTFDQWAARAASLRGGSGTKS
jgi:hypothetical protein